MRMSSTLVIVVVVLCLWLIGCSEENRDKISGNVIKYKDEGLNKIGEFSHSEEVFRLKIDTAGAIAGSVNKANLPKISSDQVQSYEGYKEMLDNLNLGIKIVNNHFDKEFDPLSTERSAYEEFTKKIDKYSPLINNYNDLIEASRNYDGTEASADKVLTSTASMGVELFLIHDGNLHKAVFSNVGEFSARIGLLKLSKICGPCVGAAMETIYWSSKNYIVDKSGKIFDYFFSLK